MAYNSAFADRVRTLLDGVGELKELTMFGGVGWTVHGNLAIGTLGDVLICRVGPDAESLIDDTATLQEWLDRGISFASRLAPKPGK